MGNNATRILPYDRIEGGGEGGDEIYDQWGFKPTQLNKPTQYTWSTVRTDGRPAMKNASKGALHFGYGLLNSDLKSFGNYPLFTDDQLGYEMLANNYSKVQDVYLTVGRQPNNQWMFSPFKEDICRPENFPYCDMIGMQRSSDVAQLWNDLTISNVDRWKEAVDRAYSESYVNGGFDAMKEVNEKDTTNYDPCAKTGMIAFLVPLILGTISARAYLQLLAPQVNAAVNADAQIAMQLGSAGVGFFWARASEDIFGPTGLNFERSAQSVTLPIGYAMGNYLAINSVPLENVPPALISLVMAYAMDSAFTGTLARTMKLSTGIFGGILGLLTALATIIESTWCRLTTANFDACMDKGEHPKGRRWDAVSIAGMLTDEVCEKEGWLRDDPKAEFVFHGLLTGPHMMEAATGTAEGQTSIFNITTVNPLGEIYPPQYFQYANPEGTMFYYAKNLMGWDGRAAGWLDVASANMYACQNWDVLRNAAQPGGGPEAQLVKANFDVWTRDLIQAAYEPGAITAMNSIPGWTMGATDRPIALGPSPQACRDLIEQVYQAETINERAHLTGDISFVTPCADYNIHNWLNGNRLVYKWFSNANNTDMNAFFAELTAPDSTMELHQVTQGDPELLSAYLRAASATNQPELFAMWARSPPGLTTLALRFPNPPPAWLPTGMLGSEVALPPALPTPIYTPGKPVGLRPPMRPIHTEPPVFAPLGPPILSGDPTSALCQENKVNALNADSLQLRSFIAATPKNVCTDVGMLVWSKANAVVYAYITSNADMSPYILGLYIDTVLAPVIAVYPTAKQLALWAIRTAPVNAAQLEEFTNFWVNHGAVPPSLAPQGSEPAGY